MFRHALPVWWPYRAFLARVRFLPLIGLACLLAGCATSRNLPAFQPASSENAIVRWQGRGVSLTSDAVLARSANGTVLARLYKQSPAPLAEFRLEPDGYFTASDSQSGRKWAGPSGNAPAALSVWVTFLNVYQNAAKLPDGSQEVHSAANRIASQRDGRRLKSLSVVDTDTAEAVSAIFR